MSPISETGGLRTPFFFFGGPVLSAGRRRQRTKFRAESRRVPENDRSRAEFRQGRGAGPAEARAGRRAGAAMGRPFTFRAYGGRRIRAYSALPGLHDMTADPNRFRLTPLRLGVAALLLAGAGETGTRIDTDGDGRYSLAELREFYPALSQVVFARIDADGDGRVSPGEFRAAQDDGLLLLASGS